MTKERCHGHAASSANRVPNQVCVPPETERLCASSAELLASFAWHDDDARGLEIDRHERCRRLVMRRCCGAIHDLDMKSTTIAAGPGLRARTLDVHLASPRFRLVAALAPKEASSCDGADVQVEFPGIGLASGSATATLLIGGDGEFVTAGTEGSPAARSAALVLLFAWCSAIPAFAATPAGEWPASARDPQNTRFSPLEQVTRQNVAALKLAFTFATGVDRGQEAAPLVRGRHDVPGDAVSQLRLCARSRRSSRPR